MKKIDMRDWISSVEERCDTKLAKWRKIPKVENGESIQLSWQWEQTRMSLVVFWEDSKEAVHFTYTSPRIDHLYRWSGLTVNTYNLLMDRIGNLAQVTMYPISSMD